MGRRGASSLVSNANLFPNRDTNRIDPMGGSNGTRPGGPFKVELAIPSDGRSDCPLTIPIGDHLIEGDRHGCLGQGDGNIWPLP